MKTNYIETIIENFDNQELELWELFNGSQLDNIETIN